MLFRREKQKERKCFPVERKTTVGDWVVRIVVDIYTSAPFSAIARMCAPVCVCAIVSRLLFSMFVRHGGPPPVAVELSVSSLSGVSASRRFRRCGEKLV